MVAGVGNEEAASRRRRRRGEKEKNSRRRRRLVRILFNDKSVEIYALRDYPCRRRREEYDMHFFFFVQPHTQITQKNTGTRAPILYTYIYIRTLYAYARWILRIKYAATAATLFDFVRRRRRSQFREPNVFFPWFSLFRRTKNPRNYYYVYTHLSSATVRDRANTLLSPLPSPPPPANSRPEVFFFVHRR